MSRFHAMIKPCGPACNLACRYCFYLPKERSIGLRSGRMDEETLELFIRQYLASQGPGPVTFAWQGGEPTLMGIDFFKQAVDLQQKYRRSDQQVENTLQTNGVLLDDRWCRFLREYGFLVGLSVDGPGLLHDTYRTDRKGGPTLSSVVQASRLLRKNRVDFNTLTVVHRLNARRPLQVYPFLRNIIGARYMQFIPCVEPRGFEMRSPRRFDQTSAPVLGSTNARPGSPGSVVTDWSVDPLDYGSFMSSIFDEWSAKDVGRVFIINFEVVLAAWLGLPPAACTFARSCGNALAIEHDGSVYSCDHFVYPEHRLGNIHEADLASMASSGQQSRFGDEKAKLPGCCLDCRFLFACWGECPRNRFIRTSNGEYGLNYLCSGLFAFFDHIDPWMRFNAGELRAGRQVGARKT